MALGAEMTPSKPRREGADSECVATRSQANRYRGSRGHKSPRLLSFLEVDFATEMKQMQQASDPAVNRLQRITLEITAYREELRLFREDGRIPGVSDLQRYGDAAERWTSELDSIRRRSHR